MARRNPSRSSKTRAMEIICSPLVRFREQISSVLSTIAGGSDDANANDTVNDVYNSDEDSDYTVDECDELDERLADAADRVDDYSSKSFEVLIRVENPYEITECAFCCHDFIGNVEVKTIACGHVYHTECLSMYDGVSCPICREDV